MKSGVYQILNTANNKCYVGSAVYIIERWRVHRCKIQDSSHSKKLQNAINKYGADKFVFKVLEYCSPEDLTRREQYWIDTLDSFKNGYNTRRYAENNLGSKRGPPSEETRKKLSIASTGKVCSEETKKKISAARKGGVVSKEQRKKLRGYGIGNTWNVGRAHSEEARKKMSEAGKRKIFTEKHLQNMRVALSKTHKGNTYNKGKTLSEETRKKMSDSHKIRWAKRKLLGEQ